MAKIAAKCRWFDSRWDVRLSCYKEGVSAAAAPAASIGEANYRAES
ncbi:MAG: hypothetical protein KME26_12965 [Oscillatoria princeps RMCB-10]|nr:hypothetical protein [Oscillatoria princeps RMCB-10]